MASLTKRLGGNVTTVFNASGFLASSVQAKLAKLGSQMVLAHRASNYEVEKYRLIGGLGQVFFAKYSLRDEDSIREAMKHSNIVINCIGKINPTKNFPLSEVNTEGPRRIARIAKELGVEKFIHLSALNCTPNPEPQVMKHGSEFLRTKYYGELAVREEFPEAVIFRPSNIVGEQDDFITHWTSLVRTFHTRSCAVWDYYDGVEKQPVYVRDLAAGIVEAVLNDQANGKIFQGVGPYRYRYYDLIEYIRHCGGQGKLHTFEITNLRWDIYRFFVSLVPYVQTKEPFISWHRIEHDMVSDKVDPRLPTLEDLGVTLTPLEKIIEVAANKRPRLDKFYPEFEEEPAPDMPERLNLNVAK